MSKYGFFPVLFPGHYLCCFSGLVSDEHKQQQKHCNYFKSIISMKSKSQMVILYYILFLEPKNNLPSLRRESELNFITVFPTSKNVSCLPAQVEPTIKESVHSALTCLQWWQMEEWAGCDLGLLIVFCFVLRVGRVFIWILSLNLYATHASTCFWDFMHLLSYFYHFSSWPALWGGSRTSQERLRAE